MSPLDGTGDIGDEECGEPEMTLSDPLLPLSMIPRHSIPNSPSSSGKVNGPLSYGGLGSDPYNTAPTPLSTP